MNENQFYNSSLRKAEIIQNRLSLKLTDKLQLKKRISPNKIFELFKMFIQLPDEKKSKFCLHTKSEIALLNSIQYSFEFCKERHTGFSYNSKIENINKKHPELTLFKNHGLEDLSIREINNIRGIVIIMQNQNCFNNFNPLLASKIITYNFQCIDKNSNNSLANNRRVFKEHCIKSDKNNSKFTPLISDVKLHLISHFF